VKLLLYRGSHNVGYGFQAVIGTVEMDQRGEGTYLLQTASDDPPGTYSIQTMPGSRGVHFPEIHGGVFCVTRTRDPAECSLSESLEELARNVVTEAGRTLVNAIGPRGGTVDLDCAFDAAALAEVRAEVEGLHARSRFVEARLTAPIAVRSASVTAGQDAYIDGFEAEVVESWDARVLGADGSLVDTWPENRARRYRVVRRMAFHPPVPPDPYPRFCGTGWLIEEITPLGW
jgi:hypothetical protein